jgi:hypothetical protein
MGVPNCAGLAIVISALSVTVPATAQERGNQAPAVGNPSGARTTPRSVDTRDNRRNLALANRMTGIPEFVQALRNGDARAAKRIFVAHGGSDDQVILVPARGWNPTTGYNVSEPFPVDTPINPVVCEIWHANTVVLEYPDAEVRRYYVGLSGS